MKSGQLIEYNKIFFFKHHTENETGKLVPDPFLLFKKVIHEVKASDLQLGFNISQYPSTWHAIKTNYIKF